MNHEQENEYSGHQEIPSSYTTEAAYEEKSRNILKHFHIIANKYDFMNTFLSLGIHHLWKRRAVKMMDLREKSFVIDVCGGTGDLARYAARDMKYRGQIILYDINSAMMHKGMEKIHKIGLEDHIHRVQGNAESLPFPSHLFDGAMIGFGIRNVTHRETCLREIYRVLKPGGKFMCRNFLFPLHHGSAVFTTFILSGSCRFWESTLPVPGRPISTCQNQSANFPRLRFSRI